MKQDTHGSKDEEWVGFDLDGTLAKYDGWKGVEHLGEPVDRMVLIAKLLHWLGKKVKVLTARVAPRDDGEGGDKARKYVEKWCEKHLGFVPEITYHKDASMAALFDDRAVAVEAFSFSQAAKDKILAAGGEVRELLAEKLETGQGRFGLHLLSANGCGSETAAQSAPDQLCARHQ